MAASMTKIESKRERRRRDLLRMRAKARRVYPNDAQGRMAEHLAACSCWMCGNPRRFAKGERLTVRERREEENPSL
jgi:hypothetical protein